MSVPGISHQHDAVRMSPARERALGEVLRIINRSHGAVQDVISSVLGYALDLCDAEFGILFESTPASGYEATYWKGIPQPFEDWLLEQGRFRAGRRTGLGRVASTREFVNIADVRAEDAYRSGDPLREATVQLGGARSFAAIPMLAGGRLIGAFTVYRQRVRPFDDRTLEVAQIFADQSVIAIENARRLGQR